MMWLDFVYFFLFHPVGASNSGQEIEYTDKYNMAAKLKRRYKQQVVVGVVSLQCWATNFRFNRF